MKKTLFLMAAAVVIFVSGCTSVSHSPAPKPVLPQIDLQPAHAAADKFTAQFLSALADNNCKEINTALLTDTVAKNMTQDSFSKYSSGIGKHLGKVVKSVYVCDLNNPLYRSFIWKLSFERKTAAPESKIIAADVLFQVQVVKVDDQYKILNFIITR